MKTVENFLIKMLLTFLCVTFISIVSIYAESTIDSTQILNGINTGGVIVSTVVPAKYSTLVVQLTGLISVISPFIIGLVHRRYSINKLKKDGKLIE